MEITLAELDTEGVELLPAREALGWFNAAFVAASNSSTALNALSVLSLSASQANQGIVISQ